MDGQDPENPYDGRTLTLSREKRQLLKVSFDAELYISVLGRDCCILFLISSRLISFLNNPWIVEAVGTEFDIEKFNES